MSTTDVVEKKFTKDGCGRFVSDAPSRPRAFQSHVPVLHWPDLWRKMRLLSRIYSHVSGNCSRVDTIRFQIRLPQSHDHGNPTSPGNRTDNFGILGCSLAFLTHRGADALGALKLWTLGTLNLFPQTATTQCPSMPCSALEGTARGRVISEMEAKGSTKRQKMRVKRKFWKDARNNAERWPCNSTCNIRRCTMFVCHLVKPENIKSSSQRDKRKCNKSR